ncbi:hypothetical protein LOK49_LG01G02624 [Camellia lanceoleosa]|uniref:Uncharacterized protein n=1 Tax=Camellia lanceoleosa TaxID=1840588 RepID=A0ACC0J4N7_9ERIC|nr:hypothetical protein LOK49_LG01G02624 [Camellia lanceoleosa]
MRKKKTTVKRRPASRQCRPTRYPSQSYHVAIPRKKIDQLNKYCSKSLEKEEDYHDATCSICMEYPHNAILLLCSSRNKGCRPYMCATNHRYSNCFDRYKKGESKLTELLCPLCRGQVKSWTVDEQVRQYLNNKVRICMQDDCSFVGTYKELRQHTRAVHPLVGPRQVDPVHEQNWKKMEHEREHDDVISTIRSLMPGAVIVGDYIIDNRGPVPASYGVVRNLIPRECLT